MPTPDATTSLDTLPDTLPDTRPDTGADTRAPRSGLTGQQLSDYRAGLMVLVAERIAEPATAGVPLPLTQIVKEIGAVWGASVDEIEHALGCLERLGLARELPGIDNQPNRSDWTTTLTEVRRETGFDPDRSACGFQDRCVRLRSHRGNHLPSPAGPGAALVVPDADYTAVWESGERCIEIYRHVADWGNRDKPLATLPVDADTPFTVETIDFLAHEWWRRHTGGSS